MRLPRELGFWNVGIGNWESGLWKLSGNWELGIQTLGILDFYLVCAVGGTRYQGPTCHSSPGASNASVRLPRELGTRNVGIGNWESRLWELGIGIWFVRFRARATTVPPATARRGPGKPKEIYRPVQASKLWIVTGWAA